MGGIGIGIGLSFGGGGSGSAAPMPPVNSFQPTLQTSNPVPAINDVRFRNPQPSDDSSRRYAVDAYWYNQAADKLFQATAVTAGSATWVERTVGQLPYDALVAAGGTAQGVYGTDLLVAAYSGPCMRIRRDDTKAEADIGFINGRLDAGAITSFAGNITEPGIQPSLEAVMDLGEDLIHPAADEHLPQSVSV